MATPFRRCEYTKSNVFLNSCTLLVIFLSLSSSLWCNCSCTAFCNSLNLSSSMPSNSGGSGRPLNMNSNIPISFISILSFCLFPFALSVPGMVFSYMAFTCDIILVITLIVFFIRYQKTMQTMLTAFITMNRSNSGIPSAKTNSISRTFPLLFMIKIPEEEQIVEDLQEIESMQLVVQVIMVIVCIIIAFIVLYYCCQKFRHMCTLFKFCFPFLPISGILRTSLIYS